MGTSEPQPQEPNAPAPPSGVMRNPVVPAATLIGLGGLLLILGSFLPWLTFTVAFTGTISHSGMEGGAGIVTLVLGVVTLLIGVTTLTGTQMPSFLQGSPIVTGSIAFVVAWIDYGQVQRRITSAKAASELVSGSAGAGLWTLFVGAAVTIAGGALISKWKPSANRMPSRYRTWPDT
jgi:hypothetical protein